MRFVKKGEKKKYKNYTETLILSNNDADIYSTKVTYEISTKEGEAKIMGYDTLMVHSVVIIPKLRDHKSGVPVNETRKEHREVDGKKDFESILRQAMR